MAWVYLVLAAVAACLWIQCGAIANRISRGLTKTPPALVDRVAGFIGGPLALIAILMMPKKPY